jgi:hypothetical protein
MKSSGNSEPTDVNMKSLLGVKPKKFLPYPSELNDLEMEAKATETEPQCAV